MDKSFHRRESDIQQPNDFLVSLQIFEDILNWLAGFIRLTEEERGAAGIYLGDQYSSNTQSEKQP